MALEPAFDLINGYSIKAWEWEEGIRSYLLPSVYMMFIKVINQFGIIDTILISKLLRALTAIFMLSNIYLAYKITAYLTNSRLAFMTALFIAINPYSIYFDIRTMAETIVTPFLLLSSYLFLKSNSKKTVIFSGVLLALAFTIRFQTSIIPFSLFFYFILKKNYKSAFLFSLGILPILLLYGLIDFYIWGSFFHSPYHYIRINLIEGFASKHFGEQSWAFYLYWFSKIFSIPVFAIFIGGLVVFIKRIPVVMSITVLSFFILHQLTGHKEGRFLIPLIPYFIIMMSLFIHEQSKYIKKKYLNKGFYVFSLLLIIALSLKNYQSVPWNRSNKSIRLLHSLSNAKNLNGILIIGINKFESSGYFYLNQNVPLYFSPKVQIKREFIQLIKNLNINHIINLSDQNQITKKLTAQGLNCNLISDNLYKCGRTILLN
jgi:hypothetical protein